MSTSMDIRSITRKATTILLGLLITGLANAGVILVDTGGGVAQINHYEPIGQSFTAIDTNVQAGLDFQCINCGFSNNSSITYDLYEGQGTGGSLLASSTFSLTTGYTGFYLEDFSSISLAVGSLYSLVASINAPNSPYWGVIGTSVSDYYTEGSIVNGPPNWYDSNIKVVGVTPPASVSEPATLALLGLGLFGISLTRRK